MKGRDWLEDGLNQILMTILSILQTALIGKEIEVYQSKLHADLHFPTTTVENWENYTKIKVVVTKVTYIEPWGEYEQEGGDCFNVEFAGGYITLQNI